MGTLAGAETSGAPPARRGITRRDLLAQASVLGSASLLARAPLSAEPAPGPEIVAFRPKV